MPKTLNIWTTDEIIKAINELMVPISTKEYRQGFEDAKKALFNSIKKADKKAEEKTIKEVLSKAKSSKLTLSRKDIKKVVQDITKQKET